MLSNIAGYEWPVEGTKQVVYTTWDDHVHEMVTSSAKRWRDVDITRDASAPIVPLETAILTGYAWPEGRTRQIDYVSPGESDGHVHELVMMEGKAWNYEDIMEQVPQAVLADGTAIVGYSWHVTGSKQVVYTGRDNHLHELSVGTLGMWRYVDLTNFTGAPEPEGSALAAFAYETLREKYVAFVDLYGHIHEMVGGINGNWTRSDVTNLTNAPVADSSLLIGFTWNAQLARQILFLDTNENPHIHELMIEQGSSWQHSDLTNLTGARNMV